MLDRDWPLVVLLALDRRSGGVAPATLAAGLAAIDVTAGAADPAELAAEGLVEERDDGVLRLTDIGRQAAGAAVDSARPADQPRLQLLYEVKRDSAEADKPFAGVQLDPPQKLSPRRAIDLVRTLFGRLLYEHGLDTAATQVRSVHFHPDQVRYAPTGWRALPSILRHYQIEPTDVFADFGAGKGRILLQAAQRPFARVVGIEIDPELAVEARRNLERARPRLRCRDVDVVTGDAARWQVPDDVTYAYFYIPFTGEVARAAVANLVASLDRTPRRLRIIHGAREGSSGSEDLVDAIRASGRFDLERTERGERYGWITVRVFVSRPDAPS